MNPEPNDSPDNTRTQAALEAILASPGFARKRRGQLLRYLVERVLAGEGDRITEYAIALDVFRKPDSFDPANDASVRVEMTRMRKALAEYYESAGRDADWRFEFPLRAYAPAFVRHRPDLQPGTPQPEPAPATANTLRSSLRLTPRVIAVLAAALLVAAGLWVWRVNTVAPAIRAVIVLPFANLTGDPANDYLADGLTESLTDSLAHVPSLRVVARTSAFQFRSKSGDIREIGRKVDADGAVEGSIRKSEGHLRITVQLNRTTDGYHVLSRVFDGELGDLPRLESEMALPVLSALRPSFRPAESRTPDAEARDLVLRARAITGLSPRETFDKVVALLNQAIAKDPGYAGAYAQLAVAYAGASTSAVVEPVSGARSAKAAAEHAIRLDPMSAPAHAAGGYVDAMVLLHWREGEQELRDAVRLMPQNATARQWLALVLMAQGHFDSALVEARAAADLDPLSASVGSSPGMILFMQRKYGDALTEWRRLSDLHPGIAVVHAFIGMALEARGNFKEAEAEFQTVRATDPDTSDFEIVYLLSASGRKAEARALLSRLESTHPDNAFDFAVDYGALGDRDRAFNWLEKAWEHRIMYLVKIHPFLDPLRSDPRYAAFLQRAGFEN